LEFAKVGSSVSSVVKKFLTTGAQRGTEGNDFAGRIAAELEKRLRAERTTDYDLGF